ncbi:SH3 domain-binding glutamic acid-rich-like protein 2 isoform X1 [Perca flavescens]|uniref:SH3 domain-binding glutamic acid-rich-like protein 2 isoform X1 n=1 Tax=Perca flavescens TaxID=8167 RepID=UPI00106EFE87|nr:SH3 domain-binding glutamic acid-rich-like protein 2 isoform X1 [Perca flavescens]
MVIKVYIASSTGSVAVKKHQQAVVGFLEANRISFQEVDITMLEEQRLWMYRNIPRDKQPEKGNPLPPQIFNEDRYCGDYDDFFQSKEDNTVFAFLGLSSQPSVKCHLQSHNKLLDPPLCSDCDWLRKMDSNTDSRDR